VRTASDRELLEDARDVMLAAIKAGDWKVDGACDPETVLLRIACRLAQPNDVRTHDVKSKIGDW
jgi:hypothetical protein